MNGAMLADQMRGMAQMQEPQPLLERLKRRKEDLAKEMSRVDKLIGICEKNPEMEQLMTLLGRVQI
jgi:hypothetical protein